jgi:hypothetical protein
MSAVSLRVKVFLTHTAMSIVAYRCSLRESGIHEPLLLQCVTLSPTFKAKSCETREGDIRFVLRFWRTET